MYYYTTLLAAVIYNHIHEGVIMLRAFCIVFLLLALSYGINIVLLALSFPQVEGGSRSKRPHDVIK